ncbi:MAG: YceH family protein [Actinomycetota bacterium]|nr:YceH family protein [Actinomycetota bacterium]
MDFTAEEIRVLGCLIEKGATTPDQYPLSTNALLNACNQKSSREPVVSYTERMVVEAMKLLRAAGLARTVTGGSRVEKHRHVLGEVWSLDDRQQALLAVLALRGPQTPGELRTRTDRYVSFDDLTAVEETLASLADRPEPLVVDLGRGPGQSQNRWTHLLAGEPALGAGNWAVAHDQAVPDQRRVDRDEGRTPASRSELEARIIGLEARVALLEEAFGLPGGSA